jgi:hypothetical protein
LLVGGGCRSTELTSSWSPPDVKPIQFRKVVVLCLAKDKVTRRMAEDTLVAQIKRAQAVPGYRVIPDEDLPDPAKVRSRVAAAGFDGAVTMRLLAVKKEVTRVAGSYNYPSHYRRFGGYYRTAWSGMYRPDYVRVDDVLQIETHLYSVADEKLIWAGTSETFSPESTESLIKEIAVVVAQDLRKRGLIPPEEAPASEPSP